MNTKVLGLSKSQLIPKRYQTIITLLKNLWVSKNILLLISFFIDLEKIQKKLNDKQYRTKEEFKSDIAKIFDNARIYNQEDTIYYKNANLLQNFVRPILERLKECS